MEQQQQQQQQQSQQPRPGDLSWRLSSHPITLLCFLTFRLCKSWCLPCSRVPLADTFCVELIASLLVYLFGLRTLSHSFVLIFIITILLLATDFYYLKNIAGRRLVGLRWWNEVDTATGDSHWVFESQDRGGDASGVGAQNLTDKRFFWLALYAQPGLWVGLAIFAIVRFENPIWLSLVVIALVLTITNTIAFSRCDRFSHATNLASSAMYSGGIARNLAGGVFSRMFGGNR